MADTKSTSLGRKLVRVVARVRSPDPVTQSSASGDLIRSISVLKPKGDESESVSISFGDQLASSKDSYLLDYCYEENETTGLIFTKEIRPLLSSVFDGTDANVIACGARNSGKTNLIQGSEREPGLAMLTLAEMLRMAEERGSSISVSIYEVSQETVYDLLNQEKRVVSVLEGAQKKIQLKGLSQVPVKTLSEFQNLYFGPKKIQNVGQKVTSDPPRSHKGVMVHVSMGNGNSGSHARMNFVDMAGYEDSRKQNSDLAPLEITRINKSIYALQNVMYALNANESHVPYRESKLTHMLKDCLRGCNKSLLITCLPRTFSQDSSYMLNLASRIRQGSNRSMTNPTKKVTGSAKSISSSSTAQRRQTPLAISATSIKQTGLRGNVTERKTKVNTATPVIKGRKLFGEANDSVKCKNNSKKMEGKPKIAIKEEISTSEVNRNVQASSSEEENSSQAFSSSAVTMEPSYSISASFISEGVEHSTVKETPVKHEEATSGASCCDDAITGKAQIVEEDNNNSPVVEDSSLVNEGENLDKENNIMIANETKSPPLSIRLQELSNTLKYISNISNQPSAPEKSQTASTKSQVENAPENSNISAEAVSNVELQTPEKALPSNFSSSPWKTFSAQSSKLKKSVVGEYLKFLNTAEKEDLKKLKGIGERRATYIVQLREESPEPFKTLDDLKDIGLSQKQVKEMMKKEVVELMFD